MAEAKICAVEGCGKDAKTKGWCAAHYVKWRRYGSPLSMKRGTPNPNPPATCTVDGCEKPHKSLGYCVAHYTRFHRHGGIDVKLRASNGECLTWIAGHLHFAGDECLIWPYASGGRGDAVVLYEGHMRSAARVMCEMAHGPAPEEDYECAHSCGNGHIGCMNQRHLRWDSRSGNHADKVVHGTDNRGEKHPNAKLTVAAVRRILSGGDSPAQLSDLYGVSKATIKAIRSGKRLRHVAN